jgi:hypothetical protein
MKQFLFCTVVAVAGCSSTTSDGTLDDLVGAEPAVVEVPSVVAPPPPVTATSVEEFDTTSQADRVIAASAEVVDTEAPLGMTIASLGSPAEPGIWLKTPLVSEVIGGRVDYQGTTINIELRPSGGAVGSGSEISLSAMRLLNAPLTGLPELTVFAGGSLG